MINDTAYGKLTSEKVVEILESIKEQEATKWDFY
jgi:NADH:ubiquinone oxidoreductase subunit E